MEKLIITKIILVMYSKKNINQLILYLKKNNLNNKKIVNKL